MPAKNNTDTHTHTHRHVVNLQRSVAYYFNLIFQLYVNWVVSISWRLMVLLIADLYQYRWRTERHKGQPETIWDPESLSLSLRGVIRSFFRCVFCICTIGTTTKVSATQSCRETGTKTSSQTLRRVGLWNTSWGKSRVSLFFNVSFLQHNETVTIKSHMSTIKNRERWRCFKTLQ